MADGNELPEEVDDQGEDDSDDGWCMLCGDTFRYDDTGGYNPPCECGFHCRSCHVDYEADEYDEWDDDDREDEPDGCDV